jgi:hypothetical protein
MEAAQEQQERLRCWLAMQTDIDEMTRLEGKLRKADRTSRRLVPRDCACSVARVPPATTSGRSRVERRRPGEPGHAIRWRSGESAMNIVPIADLRPMLGLRGASRQAVRIQASAAGRLRAQWRRRGCVA